MELRRTECKRNGIKMKKLVVLGSSPAAIKAVDLVLEKSSDFDITILLHEESCPYKRDLFTDMLAKKVSVDDIFCHARKYYKDKGINIVNDKSVSRINLKTRKIYTEQKQQFDFDNLILAEMPEGKKLTEIKGGNKEGIYSLRKIKYVDRIIKEMPFFETVIIQSDTFAGWQQAQMFVEAGKEVYLVVPKRSLLACVKDEQAQCQLRETLSQKNLFIIENNMIEEILGEAQLKAVRLSSGKVIGADIVVLGEVTEDVKMIEEFHPNLNEGRLVVDERYCTNIDGVFAVDAMCWRSDYSMWSDFAATALLEKEGRCVAAALINDEFEEAEDEVIEHRFTVGEQTIDHLYHSAKDYRGESLFYVDADRSVFIELVVENNCVVGATIVNDTNHKKPIKKYIADNEAADILVMSLGLQQIKQEDTLVVENMNISESENETGEAENNECTENPGTLKS